MRLILLGSLALAPGLGLACECMPDVEAFAPGGEIVGRRPVFFVDTGDQTTVDLRVSVGEGRAVPFQVEPYGAHVLRVRVKRRLPLGAVLQVQAYGSSGDVAETAEERRFVVGRAQLPPPGSLPLVWRDRNTSFCGTSEYLGLAWPEPTPGAWAIWLGDGDRVPPADTPPLMVAPAYIQQGGGVINAEIESCWSDGVALPTPPWREGSSTLTLRRIRLDGGLDEALTLPLPAPPVETFSGLN